MGAPLTSRRAVAPFTPSVRTPVRTASTSPLLTSSTRSSTCPGGGGEGGKEGGKEGGEAQAVRHHPGGHHARSAALDRQTLPAAWASGTPALPPAPPPPPHLCLVVEAALVADDLESHELVRLPVEALHTSAYVSIRQHTLAYSLSY